ncbi:glutamate-rich WD repeat-containing protein 1 [Condylostylus longicornis]|uniref:glutamate-rich WD repeat-containing protein 1 n=1 Tax=Condylostylus longicornis TaxID=2530218 RepID=UPI00244D9A7F|nr:glutamate-rich WD repeat-containing protein 1 [Condylostylus longicornis]
MNNDEEMEIVEPECGDDEMVDSDDDSENDNSIEKSGKKKEVYLPGKKPLQENEELVCDESAYIMLHQAHTGAPCLSFDIIRDELNSSGDRFPMTSYMVAGTQAARAHVNNVIVMKMYNLHRTSKEDEDDEVSDDDDVEEEDNDLESEEKKPKMSCALIKHQGCVNRIRTTKLGNATLAASWSELGRVNIWNLNEQLVAIEDEAILKKYEKNQATEPSKPVFTFSGHQQEGFAVDWSPVVEGFLATGDCRRDIHIWQPVEGSSWRVDQRPLIGHTESVEDIQWSPNERSVMASCSVDKSIRIWDIRAPPQKACMLTAENSHETDINVISWNKNEPFIVSGGDDGFLHIWDLRQFQTQKPVATFKHHTGHVTTVEWHPRDSTVFASGGSDDQIALWDLAVEKDEDEDEVCSTSNNQDELKNLPPQLLFIHQGQQDIKELHWHPQLTGVILSTANSGFNIFRTISV